MTTLRLLALALVVSALPASGAAQTAIPPRPELYKFVTIQAAPGKLPDLLALYQEGAAWDVITLDAWKDWRQYGEAQMVPADVSAAAAKKAGFESADAVGVAMRSLINTHHDTLGSFVSLAPAK